MLDVGTQLQNVLSFKREILRCEMVQATSQRPDVYFERVCFLPDELWGKVQRSTYFRSIKVSFIGDHLGHSQVAYLMLEGVTLTDRSLVSRMFRFFKSLWAMLDL